MPDQYQKWKSLQSHWDDDEFLKSLTPLMKLRYRRLDERVGEIFEDQFKGTPKPFLLDVGCGRAEFAAFLRERWRDVPSNQSDVWNYLGVEPSAEQLRQRDIPHMGLGFIQATAEQLPLQDMLAHGVLIKEAIDHCFDPSKVFAQAKRLLKPGGVLVVTVTNDKSYFKRLLPFVNRARKAGQTDHLFFFGPDDLRKLAEESKFDRVSVETYNYLKLPRVFEQVLSLFGTSLNRALLNLTDLIGKVLLPGLGGGIILKAFKK
ncbi:MAG TPA: methyltransferase domain-containing protein [bacterium]|nr:methyltransferase domain-containing protein [bacterium]